MKKTILIFSGVSIAVILLFQISKYSLLNTQSYSDVFLIMAGLLFVVLGHFVTRLFYQSKNTKDEGVIDQSRLEELKISKQEHRVLGLMSDGLSNMEIANQLFISENTVKTHVSRILSKLNAKRRTEAVKIGRDLNII